MSVEAWKTLFEWGTVVLTFLTFAFGAGVVITGNIINAHQEEQLRRFEKDLTGAKTDLGKQQERAAQAEKTASDASKAASDALAHQQQIELDLSKQKERTLIAEKTLLELRETLADRSLTTKQLEIIASKLKPFAAQEYDYAAYWDSKESIGIAERVHQALELAGWKFIPMKSRGYLLGGIVGVQVWHHPDADESTKKAVRSLIAALLKEGIQTEERIQNPVNNPKHNKISLTVGSKR
jgi:flagellar hook-length control protein FliK